MMRMNRTGIIRTHVLCQVLESSNVLRTCCVYFLCNVLECLNVLISGTGVFTSYVGYYSIYVLYWVLIYYRPLLGSGVYASYVGYCTILGTGLFTS